MKRWMRLLAAVATACISAAAAATPLSIEDIWRLPSFIAPTLSPNGEYFAVTMAVKGKMNLAVMDIASRKAVVLTNFDDYDVVNVHWVGNDRLVFSLGQFNTPVGDAESLRQGGLFTIGRDGKDFRVLAPTVMAAIKSGQWVYRFMAYEGRVKGSAEEIYVAANEPSANAADLYRLNVKTGKKELLTQGRPERTIKWLLDGNDVPRVAYSLLKDEPVVLVHYRESATAPWQELFRSRIGQEAIYPLRFERDSEMLIVASNIGRETMGIFRYDPKKRAMGELLAQHPRYDMGANQSGEVLPGVIADPQSHKIVGFEVNGAKPEVVWTDPEYAGLQRTLDAALPDTLNTFSRTPDGKRILVTSRSDRVPAIWYLFDPEKRTLEELFASRPWLTPDKLVAMQPVSYRTRDGQEQLAYLFLPPGRKPGERVPLVVHIHGGPWARADSWGSFGFGTREGQLFASHGYAVLLPQFRGTTGLGTKLFTSAVRQFGKSMQEDIEDATDWAIKEGIADPSRICLSGASYGGYSSLMGLAKTPDKYKCGVAGMAVTDLELLVTSGWGDIPRSEIGLKTWKAMAGDPATDRDALRAVSPVYLAARMKAPILIYAGVDDIRVPLEQMQNMRSALEKEGKSVVWIQKNLEGHGYARLENNVDLYTQVLDFLDRNIGKSSQRASQ